MRDVFGVRDIKLKPTIPWTSSRKKAAILSNKATTGSGLGSSVSQTTHAANAKKLISLYKKTPSQILSENERLPGKRAKPL